MIGRTDHVRNEEVLLTVNEQRNILHEIRKRKANFLFIKYSPLHVSSLKCSSSGGYSRIHEAYGTVISCRQGSQTQQCIVNYISVELHVSAYIEAIIRFNMMASI